VDDRGIMNDIRELEHTDNAGKDKIGNSDVENSAEARSDGFWRNVRCKPE
jgi:hypothetical protein